MVVGNSGDAELAFRWTRAAFYTPLQATPSEPQATVNDVNDNGVAVGRTRSHELLIWGANATVALVVPTFVRSGPFIRSDGAVSWSDGTVVFTRDVLGSIVVRPIPLDGVIELTGVS